MPHTILIADDDIDNREIAQQILNNQGYATIIATNGVEVLTLVHSQKPALILMDLSMPKLDGWQTTRRLKDDPATRDIIIIAFTAHAMRLDEDRAIASGCDDYISKPSQSKELLAKIAKWLPV